MTDRQPLNRRSFVLAVAGTATAFTAVPGHSQAKSPCMRRTGLNDSDNNSYFATTDARGCGRTSITDRDTADFPAYGRGITDSDPNDQQGRGRGGNGVTDRDSTDRMGAGQGQRGSRVTDSDANDRAGFGRNAGAPRQTGSGQRAFTGRNDADSGGRADPAGYGR